jgi:ribosome modulation factor
MDIPTMRPEEIARFDALRKSKGIDAAMQDFLDNPEVANGGFMIFGSDNDPPPPAEESAPVNWFEEGAKKARKGLTRRMIPLILREEGREADLAQFLAGFDQERANMVIEVGEQSFAEGVASARKGATRKMVPFDLRQPGREADRAHWLAGWDSARGVSGDPDPATRAVECHMAPGLTRDLAISLSRIAIELTGIVGQLIGDDRPARPVAGGARFGRQLDDDIPF